MINKYSSPSSWSDQIIEAMDKNLNAVKAENFSLSELASTLVKCAEQLDGVNDTLAGEVDQVLEFIDTELIK